LKQQKEIYICVKSQYYFDILRYNMHQIELLSIERPLKTNKSVFKLDNINFHLIVYLFYRSRVFKIDWFPLLKSWFMSVKFQIK